MIVFEIHIGNQFIISVDFKNCHILKNTNNKIK